MEGGTKSSTSRNPNPNRHKLQALAFHFLRSLSLVHRTAPNASPAARTRRIHRAAYASMAYAVGPSRAWSRALLRKLRRWPPAGMGREGARRHRRRRSAALRTSCSGIAWTKSSGTESSSSSSSSSSSMMNGAASGEYRLCEAAAAEGTLRRVVPGGEGMDCCDLLEETADYIECLSAQVRIMQTIVDSCHLS